MFKITKSVREWLSINVGIAPNATDDEMQAAAEKAIAGGKLTLRKLSDMADADTEPVADRLAEKIAAKMVGGISTPAPAAATRPAGPSPADVFAGPRIRVKAGGEMYDGTKSIGRHKKLGTEVHTERGLPVQTTSQLEYAKAGVFLKMLAKKSGLPLMLNEHEQSLMDEMYASDNWVGKMDNQWSKEISGMNVKALLSDSTSGGVYVNPEWFDEALISIPLLTGELLPLVDLKEVPRGSAVEGASIATPSLSWGVNEGTPISIYNTDSMIAEVNSSIFPVTAAIEVGRDLLSDSPAALGAELVQKLGVRLAAELDNVISNGSGTDRPEGVFVATGLGSVSSTNGTTGPPTVADYMGLMFGVSKAFRTSQRCVFIGNDTSYKRARSIQVVAASDQRLVFGMDIDRGSGASVEAYSVLGRPYKIQNDIANTTIAFGDMSQYRLYRRQGMELQWIMNDRESVRRNTALLVARARFGGRVVNATAFAKTTNAQNA